MSDSISDWFTTNRNVIVGVLVTCAVIAGGYYFARPTDPAAPINTAPSILMKGSSFLTVAVTVIVLAIGVYLVYGYMYGDVTSSGNLASTPVTSNKPVTAPSSSTPLSGGSDGGNYSIQYWMYIQDWNYKFGEYKSVIVRGNGDVNPSIKLQPAENTLDITVSVYPSGGSSSSSEPAAANNDGSSTDSTFTCSLTDVPLQTWVCIGVSLTGRTLDCYMNGKLVRSCALPGVPKPVTSALEIMPNGGFSGKVIDVYHFSRGLKPADAAAFYAKGTGGKSYTSSNTPSGQYSVAFGLFNPQGQEVKKFVL